MAIRINSISSLVRCLGGGKILNRIGNKFPPRGNCIENPTSRCWRKRFDTLNKCLGNSVFISKLAASSEMEVQISMCKTDVKGIVDFEWQALQFRFNLGTK